MYLEIEWVHLEILYSKINEKRISEKASWRNLNKNSTMDDCNIDAALAILIYTHRSSWFTHIN